jgi:hypothetical protein
MRLRSVFNWAYIVLLFATFPFSAFAGGPIESLRSAGISISTPKGWSVEEIQNMNGVLFLAPSVEVNWQANIFLELREDKEDRPLDRALSDISGNLRTRKSQFKEMRRSVQSNPNGMQFGLLEYSHQKDGTRLIDREIVVKLQGDSRLFIGTSTVESVSSKYVPVFDAFLASIRVAK